MYQGSILVKTYFSISRFYVLNNKITTIVSVILVMFCSLSSGDKAHIRKKWLKHICKKLFGGVSRSVWIAALISQIIKGHPAILSVKYRQKRHLLSQVHKLPPVFPVCKDQSETILPRLRYRFGRE